MAEVQKLIAMLRSRKPSVRYEACELLRVAPEITPQALEALEVATHDPHRDVAESASNALRVHLAVGTVSCALADAHDATRGISTPRQPRVHDYVIAVLPGVAAPHCLFMWQYAASGSPPWEWYAALPYFLRAGPLGYLPLSEADALFNWLLLLSPIVAGLFFCRLKGRTAGVLASVALGLVCFFWFWVTNFRASGEPLW